MYLKVEANGKACPQFQAITDPMELMESALQAYSTTYALYEDMTMIYYVSMPVWNSTRTGLRGGCPSPLSYNTFRKHVKRFEMLALHFDTSANIETLKCNPTGFNAYQHRFHIIQNVQLVPRTFTTLPLHVNSFQRILNEVSIEYFCLRRLFIGNHPRRSSQPP